MTDAVKELFEAVDEITPLASNWAWARLRKAFFAAKREQEAPKINWNAIEALSKEETCTGLNVPDCNVCIAIKGAREMLKLRGSAEDKREREQETVLCPRCYHPLDRHKDDCKYVGDCSGDECGCTYLVKQLYGKEAPKMKNHRYFGTGYDNCYECGQPANAKIHSISPITQTDPDYEEGN